MDRRTCFADVVKVNFEDFERADVVVVVFRDVTQRSPERNVVEVSYKNFECNWVSCSLFFKFSYIILNTD